MPKDMNSITMKEILLMIMEQIERTADAQESIDENLTKLLEWVRKEEGQDVQD